MTQPGKADFCSCHVCVAKVGTFCLQAGAFPGSPIRGAAGCAFAPYDIPNVHSFGYDVVSNRSKVAAYRAPGAPIGAYGVECVMDEMAEALKIAGQIAAG